MGPCLPTMGKAGGAAADVSVFAKFTKAAARILFRRTDLFPFYKTWMKTLHDTLHCDYI